MKKKNKEEIELLTTEDEKTKNKKENKMKPIYIFLFILLVLIGTGCLIKDYYDKKYAKENKANVIEKIKTHYGNFVKVEKEAILYNKDYKEVGKAYKDVEFSLEKMDINEKTKYFKVKDKDYYLSYKEVTPIEKLTIYSDRYKSYIVFNENIITKEEVHFYDENEQLVYSLKQSLDFPIIIKEENRYGVEYNNRLLYIKSEDVKEIKKSKNTEEKTRQNIRTLTYHTIYDKNTQTCKNTVICHPTEQFDSHMKYISENKYFTLTMKELEMFLNQQIRIPTKSIVITLDDGKYAKNAVNIVEKYKINATYFIISSRYDVKDIKTTYMDFQSHSYNLHNNYKCPGGEQGGQLLCESEENVLNDLEKSKEILGKDVFAFAYPFFDWNERAKTLLTKAGFRLAFIGQYDTDGYSNFDTEKLMLRRKTIFSSDSIEVLASYLK